MPGLTLAFRRVGLSLSWALLSCHGDAERTRDDVPRDGSEASTRHARLDLPRVPEPEPEPEPAPASSVTNDDPFASEPARYSAEAGTVRIDPFGCAPVLVSFSPPAAFELDEASGDAKWSRAHGTRQWQDIQAQGAWLDFVELSVHCASRPDDAPRRAARAKRVHVEQQAEHPFAASGAPEVRALRQRFEILTERLEDPSPVLEFRNLYPDGTPPGFIYDHYEGRCWHQRLDAGVIVELRIDVPLAREAEARGWLTSLCERLATATITPG